MSAELPAEMDKDELSNEQRRTLALLNDQMPKLLRGFDGVFARYGIERQVYRFTTQRVAERGENDGCHMACCSCPPPEEACIENCPQCLEQADEVAAKDLTRDQRRTLELLNRHMLDLLRGFDEVLTGHDIDRQVYRFTTARIAERNDDAYCLMVCCRCPPPEDACTGECSSCGGKDAGPVAVEV